MSKPAPRLGKGLAALVRERAPAHPAGAAEKHGIADVPVERIAPNPRQPRTVFDDAPLEELAESIRTHGLLQPIVVRALGDGAYELIAGERRLRAARLAKRETVPAVIREATDAQALELALIENLQREDLDPLERAAAYQQYLDSFGGSIEDLARRLCESRASISNYLRLLKLHPEICYLLGSGELGMGQARALAAIIDPQRQLGLARLAVRRNLSVRQVEDLARQATEESPNKAAVEPEKDGRHRHLQVVEERLSKSLGLRVRLVSGRKKNAGRVIIAYDSLDEFDRIAERLGGSAHLD